MSGQTQKCRTVILVTLLAIGLQPMACRGAQGGLTATKPDGPAFFALWQRAEKAMRDRDRDTVVRLTSADRGKVLREVPASDLDMVFDIAVDMMPESPQPGEPAVAGDKATMEISGQEGGKPVKGQATFARENGEWKIDVMWRPAR